MGICKYVIIDHHLEQSVAPNAPYLAFYNCVGCVRRGGEADDDQIDKESGKTSELQTAAYTAPSRTVSSASKSKY